jgi:hypothetical protein
VGLYVNHPFNPIALDAKGQIELARELRALARQSLGSPLNARPLGGDCA